MNIDVVVPFYSNAERIGPTLDAVLQQRLPEGLDLNLIVVDDGTPDDGVGASALRAAYPDANVVRLDENHGRSLARNNGVASGTSEYLMLLDSDCVLEHDGVIAAHLARLEGSDVSIGAIRSTAPGVWGELGSRAGARRTVEAESGPLALLTTAHVVLKRSAFDAVGGFSVAYQEYGFEDRDLLGRLDAAGFKLAHVPDLVAVEDDQPNLRGYLHKSRMAGKHTAAIFRGDHPDLYSQTPYYRIDVGLHGWLRPISVAVKVAMPLLIRIADRAIYWPLLPMSAKLLVVRVLSAGSFMMGTAEAARGR